MVDGHHEMGELGADSPADDGHERLEPAEEQRDDDRLAHVQALHAKALANGHGKRVHRQADGYQEQLDETHLSLSRREPPRSGRRSQFALTAEETLGHRGGEDGFVQCGQRRRARPRARGPGAGCRLRSTQGPPLPGLSRRVDRPRPAAPALERARFGLGTTTPSGAASTCFSRKLRFSRRDPSNAL